MYDDISQVLPFKLPLPARLRVHPYTNVTQCNNLLERYKCIIHDGEKNDLC